MHLSENSYVCCLDTCLDVCERISNLEHFLWEKNCLKLMDITIGITLLGLVLMSFSGYKMW